MGFSGGGGSGGSSSIAGASDTTLNNPATNEVLSYDGAVSMWKNAVAQGGVLSDGAVVGGTGINVAYNNTQHTATVSLATPIVVLTTAQYNALTNEQRNNGTIYLRTA